MPENLAQPNADSWMIGYSPQLVSAVWTGYDNGQTIELTSDKTYAKNIWIQFMEEALDGTTAKSFKAPKGTLGVYINPENGKLAHKGLSRSTLYLFCRWNRTNRILYRPFI